MAVAEVPGSESTEKTRGPRPRRKPTPPFLKLLSLKYLQMHRKLLREVPGTQLQTLQFLKED